MSIELLSVNVGTPKLLGQHKGKPVYSSIAKRPVKAAEIYLTPTGLTGDQQTDTHLQPNGHQLHGGPEMAVYVYPSDHFAAWSEELAQDIGPGAFGENLTIRGLTEEMVRIDDIWQWGSVRLQVTKPRTPCYKLSMHLGVPDMIRRMNASGRCGWYMSVLKPGLVPVKGPLAVVELAENGQPTIRERYVARLPSQQSSRPAGL